MTEAIVSLGAFSHRKQDVALVVPTSELHQTAKATIPTVPLSLPYISNICLLLIQYLSSKGNNCAATLLFNSSTSYSQ
jgi:hypothetical protein